MKTCRVPNRAEVIRSYSEYERFVSAFYRGNYQLLFVLGRPGIGKSQEFERSLDQNAHLVRGWTAPLQAYMEVYHHRNKRLIFDDAEVLWKRDGGRILLRALCEHRIQKQIQWLSTSKELAKARIPQRFTTNSTVAIIANRFAFGSEEEQHAILDRGHLVFFDPTALEVHTRVGDWFWDQDIYDYIGERLHALDECSFRLYLKSWERKLAGGDWRRLIEEQFCHHTAKRTVQSLELDATCKTVEERVAKFIQQTGCCRATYFNIKRELQADDQLSLSGHLEVPRKQLRGTAPTRESSLGEPEDQTDCPAEIQPESAFMADTALDQTHACWLERESEAEMFR